MHTLQKFVRTRPRLSMTFLFGFVMFLLLPSDVSLITSALLGWNVAVWCYLALAV